MSERTYPYKAWVLTQGFNPKQVEIVRDGGRHYSEYLTNAAGKTYHEADVFATRGEAIRAGFALCDTQQADIRKRQERLEKCIAALEKANDAS